MKNHIISILLLFAIGVLGMCTVNLGFDATMTRHDITKLRNAEPDNSEAIKATQDVAQLSGIVDGHTKLLRQSSENEKLLAENDEAIVKVLAEMTRQLSQHREALEKLMTTRGYKMKI